MRGVRFSTGLLGLVGLLVGACGQQEDAAKALRQPPLPKPLSQTLAKEIAPIRQAPKEAYEAAPPFKAWTGQGEPVSPPDANKEVWRVYAERRSPLQRKTPRWQLAKANEAIEVEMPASSRHRCVLQPLRMKPDTNDYGTELKGWQLHRTLLCSGDGWQTWSAQAGILYIDAAGERKEMMRARVFLHELQDNGDVHDYVVMVRTDKERRAATHGPPQILTGVAVDDD